MDLSSLNVHAGEPHIRGAAAGAVSLEEQGLNSGFAAVYPQVIKAVHGIVPVDLPGLGTRPVSGRIGEHQLPRGRAPRIGLDANVQRLGRGGAWKNGRDRGAEKP